MRCWCYIKKRSPSSTSSTPTNEKKTIKKKSILVSLEARSVDLVVDAGELLHQSKGGMLKIVFCEGVFAKKIILGCGTAQEKNSTENNGSHGDGNRGFQIFNVKKKKEKEKKELPNLVIVNSKKKCHGNK